MDKLVILNINQNPIAKIPDTLITKIQDLVSNSVEVIHVTKAMNLMSILKDANWIIGYPFPFTFIKRNKVLKGILLLSVQIPNSFVAPELKFSVDNIKGLNSDYVAIHGVSLLNKLLDTQNINGTELTVGIIGSGSIAKEIQPLISPLVQKVITISRNKESDYQFEDYKEFLSGSDIIFPLVTLNYDTQKLFSKEIFFSSLKKDASLVNIARGELFQEDDIIDFLFSNDNSFYYTDVVFPEPYPEAGKLNNHPKIYRTNHVAGFGPDLWNRIEKKTIETLNKWLK
jgi:phosphoglycerate dehydrogenase-like enzyme